MERRFMEGRMTQSIFKGARHCGAMIEMAIA